MYTISKILLFSLLTVFSCSCVNALTPKDEKWIKTLKSITVEYLSPDRFTPFVDIDTAPEDIDYWMNLLPESRDKNLEMYIVMPTLGLISPVINIPSDSADYKNMSAWKEIDIDKYLLDWVLFYPRTWIIGQPWNPVIFGHSNYYRTKPWRYKTIFADIMNLDVGQEDEMRVYWKKSWSTSYDLYKYRINESYDTVPTDVGILKPKGGKELTVFACTDGLNGRWILRGTLIEQDEMLILNRMRVKMDWVVNTLSWLSEANKREIITKILLKTESMKKSLPSVERRNYALKYRKYVLDYIEKRLALIW